MISTESIDRARWFWANLNPWIRGLVLLGLASLAGLGGFPVYRQIKAWRVERNMDKAVAAAGEQRLAEARDLSLSVLQSGDTRIEAFRILDRTMASLRDPRHVDIARALIHHPEGSDADRLEGFSVITRSVALGLLGQTWAGLPENCRKNSAFAVCFADRLIDEGCIEQAASILLEVPENGRDVALERRLIRILIRSGKPGTLEEAHERIAKGWLSRDADESWLELMEEIPVARLDAQRLAAVRETLPDPVGGSPARLALMAARIDRITGRLQAPSSDDRLVARWRDEAPMELARFLQSFGDHDLLVGVFNPPRLANHPELLPLLVDSCERSGNWAAMKALLEAFPEGIPKSESLARAAMAFFREGDADRGRETWSAAMLEAKFAGTCEPYFRLRRIADAAGRIDEAEQAFLEGVLTGRGPLPLYSDLRPLLAGLAAKARENLVMRIFATYLPFEPANIVLLSQSSYLGCLNGLVTPEDVCRAMEPVAAAFPSEKRLGFVLATARLCQGDAAAAAAILDPMKVDPKSITPGYRAVFLACMVLNGKLSANDPLVVGFPWKSLFPSELRKFREWTRGVSKGDGDR